MIRTRHLPAHLGLAAAVAVACSPQVDPGYSGEPLATIRGAVTAEASATAADVAVLWFSNESGLCEGPSFNCSAGIGGPEGIGAEECVDANCGASPGECTPEAQDSYAACVAACGWVWSYSPAFELCVDSAAGERVSVSGEFPAAFTLDLYQPPPESALLVDADGLRVAYGWFIVAASDAETIALDLNEAPPSSIIGGTGSHVLIYAADPVPADSSWGRFLGGAYEPGFHILEVIPAETTCKPLPWGNGTYCSTTSTRYAPSPDDLDTEIGVILTAFDKIPWPGL